MSVNGIDGSGPCGSRGSFRLERHPFIERYIETCAEHLAETIGSHEIDDIILCGSFALGEGGISFDSTPALLLSDIDILVVLRRFDTLKRLLPERYELGRSCEALTDDLRFSGRVDVGLMLPEDLERMPPRPGVFDLKRHGRTICGSGRALDLVPEYPADRVGGREAVILLENRIVPLLGRFGDIAAATKGFPYEFLYEIARVYTDIATAFLSISGLYVSGYANRSRLFAEAVGRGENTPARAGGNSVARRRLDRVQTEAFPRPSRAGRRSGVPRQAVGRGVPVHHLLLGCVRVIPPGEGTGERERTAIARGEGAGGWGADKSEGVESVYRRHADREQARETPRRGSDPVSQRPLVSHPNRRSRTHEQIRGRKDAERGKGRERTYGRRTEDLGRGGTGSIRVVERDGLRQEERLR